MLALRNVTFAYAGTSPVFEAFTWGVSRGEVWAILGPSGCGKSTLLLLVAGLLHPQVGIVTVDGAQLARPRPGTGLILQEYGLLPWATVRANVELGLRIQRFYGPDGRHAPRGPRLPTEELRARVDHWLSHLDIAELADRYPGEISGGQRQRVAIARAMVLAPDLLLMDEPFSALDAPTREGLQQLTLAICAEVGLTAVLVTHNIEEAAYVGQKVLLLGAPPNRLTSVVTNPHEPGEGYRHSPAYQAACSHLRERMRSERVKDTLPREAGRAGLPAQGGSDTASTLTESREE
jgi:ABC-type nitrate/sulfonate/bicarbonate transport system ATPase subunit